MAALNFPDSPVNGEKFVASNSVEYTYDATNDTWTGAVASVISPADPDPSDVFADPPFDGGSGTKDDPYIISPALVQEPYLLEPGKCNRVLSPSIHYLPLCSTLLVCGKDVWNIMTFLLQKKGNHTLAYSTSEVCISVGRLFRLLTKHPSHLLLFPTHLHRV